MALLSPSQSVIRLDKAPMPALIEIPKETEESEDTQRHKYMYNVLSLQANDVRLLNGNDHHFSTLTGLLNQCPMKIDKIQAFTYTSLCKRLADHSYFHCSVCNDTFESPSMLLQHRHSSQCWSNQEELMELKQKLYLCRLCDVLYLDYKSMVTHIVSEFLINGFSIPSYNLDLSQCITILYIEQLYTPNMDVTLRKLRNVMAKKSNGVTEDLFEEIDKLVDKIDHEESRVSPPAVAKPHVRSVVVKEKPAMKEKPKLLNVSLNEFRAMQKSVSVVQNQHQPPPKPINRTNDSSIKIISIGGTKTLDPRTGELISITDDRVGKELNDDCIKIVNIGQIKKKKASLLKPRNNSKSFEECLMADEELDNDSNLSSVKSLPCNDEISTEDDSIAESEKITEDTQNSEDSEDQGLESVPVKAELIEEDEPIMVDEPIFTLSEHSPASRGGGAVGRGGPRPGAGRKKKTDMEIYQDLFAKKDSCVSVSEKKVEEEPKQPKKRGPKPKVDKSPKTVKALKEEKAEKMQQRKLKTKNLPPPREESGRKRTPKRKFAIEESVNPLEVPSDDDKGKSDSEDKDTTTPKIKRKRSRSSLPDVISSDALSIYEHSLTSNEEFILEDINKTTTESGRNRAEEERLRRQVEAELFNDIKFLMLGDMFTKSTTVIDTNEKKIKLLKWARNEVDRLNEVSARLNKMLHMEKARNQQLVSNLDACMKPPIKLKIQNGKSILPAEC